MAPTITSRTKHILHVVAFSTWALLFMVVVGGIPVLGDFRKESIEPWSKYGTTLSLILYVIRGLTLLPIPILAFQVCGLVFYNAFPDKPTLKASPLLCPFICVRVVTRGDYPDLVKRNVTRNIKQCLDLGMDKFMVEVVTDKAIGLVSSPRIREIVVPTSYQTKRGSLFKARALQYCLEDEVNVLNGDDVIVHLDEETLMTESSLRGILNFAHDGKYDFGQGLITYANEGVVNWLTTLADMFRVCDDMGRLRFQFKFFHKPIFNWKGSYVVTRCRAERNVSYDNGPSGSVAEDCYFAMNAYKQGYTFDFIEGEMWEKSPFSVGDFIQQRKRWMQGIYLVVHSQDIPYRTKAWLAFFLYSWITIPFTTSNLFLAALFPIPCGALMDFLVSFMGAITIYMYVFGVMKSFSVGRVGVFRFILLCVGSLCTIPFNIVIENIAVTWGCIGYKQKFYVVQKDTKAQVLDV